MMNHETLKNGNPVNQWLRLNKLLSAYRLALVTMAIVLFGFFILTFYLVNRDTLVVGLTPNEKLFFQGERKLVTVSEADVEEFSRLFIKTRYSWNTLSIENLLKELAPITSPGFLRKVEEALVKNKATLAQNNLSQDVLIRKVILDNGKVLAHIDRVIRVAEKMKMVSPLELTLTLIQGGPNRWNPLGLYVNSVTEHEVE